jgi:hypothetical protein
MLELQQVDLADLALALEDHSGEHVWWIDGSSGSVEPRFGAGNELLSELEADGRMVKVQPLPTAVGYGDMEDFVRQVRDARTREVLERAIGGRGAFRRFKDALLDYPELRRAWFAFHDARGERRAIEWLVDRGLVEPAAAAEAIERLPEVTPADLPGLIDAEAVAHRVARDLRRMYRERLRGVIMFGAWARGDAHPESELQLLVVLDAVPDRWEEKARMDRVMWRHSVRNDTVVTEVPVAEAQLEEPVDPALAGALAEGVRIA